MSNSEKGYEGKDNCNTSSFQWAGVALQAAFSPGGTKSSSWSFLDKVLVDDTDVHRTTSASLTVTEGISVLEDIDGSFPPPHPSATSSSDSINCMEENISKSSNEQIEGDDVLIDKDESDSNLNSPLTGSKKKKNRKKKIKTNEKNCKLTWGNVTEVLFTRAVSYDSVPNNGGYPIALGNEEDREVFSLDDYMSLQQSKLIARSQKLGIDITVACPTSSLESSTKDKILHLESRQHDYKKGSNPLFRPLSESERSDILKGGNILAKEINAGNISRQRSDSMVDDYTIDLSNLNKELKSIRTTRDDTGCSCKPTKVDKLSNGKMKSELIANCHLIGMEKSEIESLSKVELTNKMKEMLKQCPLCVSNNCECVKLGIPCFAEVCGCISKRGAVSQTCDNPNGQIAFDPDEVLEYRSQYITVKNVNNDLEKRDRSYSR